MKDQKKYQVAVMAPCCKACGICIALCPAGVFDADTEGKSVASRPDQCIGCRTCVVHCPDFCISVMEARHAG
jgi:2-oxoglutarate ferredoxin oxidoreductase subunit delta